MIDCCTYETIEHVTVLALIIQCNQTSLEASDLTKLNNNSTIALVIPTLNRPDSLKRTLESYFNGETIPDECIIIDQSDSVINRQQNKQMLESYSSVSKVKYIYQSVPSSTQARNRGGCYANSEIIIYSDDDVEVNNNTLHNLKEIMSYQDISMVAGWDEYTKESKSWLGYLLGTKSFRNRHIGYVTGSVLGRFPDTLATTTPTQWGMGFFLAIKKLLMDKWNLKWDENLTSYAYAEDLDFSYSYYKRSKVEGLKCIMSNKVTVRHLASQEYRIPSRKHIFMYFINRAYICYKHKMGRQSEIMMDWCNFWMVIRAILLRDNCTNYIDGIRKLHNVKAYLKKGIIRLDFYD